MQNELLNFVGDIYEASYKPGHWDVVMEKLCQLTGSKSSVLIIENQKSGNRQIISIYGISRILAVAYNAGLGRYDNTFSLIRTRINDVTILPSQELKQNNPSYYQFILKPADIGHISVVDLHKDRDIRIGLAVHRALNAPGYSDNETHILRLISPHICRAVLIQRELGNARSEARNMMSLVSKIPLGMLLVSQDGTVKFCNSVAEFVLGRHKGLSLVDDKLQAHNRENQKQLDSALQDVLDALHQRTESAAAVRTVSFTHPHSAFPLVLFISSAQEAGRGLITPDDERCARVYISDPGGQMNISAAQIAEIFALTNAEAQVTLCLVNGLKLAEIAEHNGTALETVRSQLKAVFHKLGVNTQQDVIRIIVQTMVPLTGGAQEY
jgi:DNA-binding CsgD family transcriptional regulator/PAS domain-containing protein